MKQFLLMSCLFITTLAQSQESFNYLEEVNRMVPSPNSPEARAFSKYGSIPVNLWVGAPNVSIPLYVYKGREMNLPISLTYDINARKVEDYASNVGMGWNLNLGGRVSRIVNGLPDEPYNIFGNNNLLPTLSNDHDPLLRNLFLSNKDNIFLHNTDVNNPSLEFGEIDDVIDYFQMLYDVSLGKKDISMDNYSINAMGLNDYVLLDDVNSLDPFSMQNPLLDIEYIRGPGGYWQVTDASGVKFLFEKVEQTNRQNLNGPEIGVHEMTYISSWVLTQVVSANGKDTYDFIYDDVEAFWPTPLTLYNTHESSTAPSQASSTVDPESKYSIDQQFLVQVKHNGNVIIDLTLGDREDLEITNSKVETITVKDPINGDVIKHFEFEQSYFGTDSNTNNKVNELRLKLDGIKVAGKGYDFSPTYDFKQHYSFDYDRPQDMPTRTNLGRDLLGFYNGEDNNQWLIPKYVLPGVGTFDGGIRDFDFDKAKIGILTKIHYPTEGYTEFEYEPNIDAYYEDVYSTLTLGSASVSNLTSNNDISCGDCCQDQAPNNEATSSSSNFSINSNANTYYDITFEVNNAHTYLDGELTNFKGYLIDIHGSGPNYTYEQICNGEVQPVYEFEEASEDGLSVQLIDNVILEPGFYQILVVNLDDQVGSCDGDCSLVELKVEAKEYAGQQLVEDEYAGIRVKSITDYTDNQEKATKKIYSYQELNENYPLTYFYQTTERIINNGSFGNQTLFHQISHPLKDSEPYVTYSRVTEERVNPANDLPYHGKVTYNFYNPPRHSGSYYRYQGYPFIKDYDVSVTKGQVKNKEVFDNADVLLARSETNFILDDSHAAYNEVVVHDAPQNGYKFVKVYKLPNDNYSIQWADGQIVGNQIIPPDTDPNCQECPVLTANANARVKPSYTYYDYQYPLQMKNRNFQYKGTLVSSQQITTNFSADRGYLPNQVLTTTSEDNLVLLKRTEYPEDTDIINNEPFMANLIADNKLALPIRVRTYESYSSGSTANFLLSEKKTVFNDFNSKILPSEIKTAKMGESLSTEMTISEYDGENPVEIFRPYGSRTCYVYGYNDMYPVAKIENSPSYDDLLLLQGGNLISDIKNTTNEAALLIKLNALRNDSALSDALVTTYTYLSGIGVKTITDPRGDQVTFHYDDENRLHYVTDKNGNRVSESEYNYRINN